MVAIAAHPRGIDWWRSLISAFRAFRPRSQFDDARLADTQYWLGR
jgi:hypothetical protein